MYSLDHIQATSIPQAIYQSILKSHFLFWGRHGGLGMKHCVQKFRVQVIRFSRIEQRIV